MCLHWTSHHTSLPPPFPLNRKISDINPSEIMEIVNELPAGTQILDAFNVLRENSHARDRWGTRIQQWRKARIAERSTLHKIRVNRSSSVLLQKNSSSISSISHTLIQITGALNRKCGYSIIQLFAAHHWKFNAHQCYTSSSDLQQTPAGCIRIRKNSPWS